MDSISQEVNIEEFLVEDFSPQAFYLGYKRKLPLSELFAILKTHQTWVKNQLVEVINAKYSDFVELSGCMQDLHACSQPLAVALKTNLTTLEQFVGKYSEITEKAEKCIEAKIKVSGERYELEELKQYFAEVKGIEGEFEKLKETPFLTDYLQKVTKLKNFTSRLKHIRFFLGQREQKLFQLLQTDIGGIEAKIRDKVREEFKAILKKMNVVRYDYTKDTMKSAMRHVYFS